MPKSTRQPPLVQNRLLADPCPADKTHQNPKMLEKIQTPNSLRHAKKKKSTNHECSQPDKQNVQITLQELVTKKTPGDHPHKSMFKY